MNSNLSDNTNSNTDDNLTSNLWWQFALVVGVIACIAYLTFYVLAMVPYISVVLGRLLGWGV